MPFENIYGRKSRSDWLKIFIDINQEIIDIGCGTGFSLTIPLMLDGYSITGVDLDCKSIEYGRKLLASSGLDINRLKCKNFSEVVGNSDVVILSHVLEYMSDKAIDELLKVVFEKLSDHGKLLVQVPNGYGWFELESFLWKKFNIEKFLLKYDIRWRIEKTKMRLFKLKPTDIVDQHPNSLDFSPHIQKFTYFSIVKKLKKHGFKIISKKGGSLFCGPMTDLLFTGVKPVMRLNKFFGNLLSLFASDFYVATEKDDIKDLRGFK